MFPGISNALRKIAEHIVFSGVFIPTSHIQGSPTTPPCISYHLLSKKPHIITCCSCFFSFYLSFLFSSSQSRFSHVKVVLTFNISLNAFAPSAPILLPVIHSSFLSLFFSFFLTQQLKWCQSGVHFQYFTQCFCSFISNLIPCYSFFLFILLMYHFFPSLWICNCLIVLFIFSISLIAFAPSAPIPFSDIHSSFFFSFLFILSPPRSSDSNDLLTFSIEQIDLTPSAPISLPVVRSDFFSFYISFSLFITFQIHFCQCGVDFQYFTQCFCSLISNLIACYSFIRFFFIFFHSSSPLRSSSVNVVLTFSISLIAFAPSTPIPLPVIHSFLYFSSLFSFFVTC